MIISISREYEPLLRLNLGFNNDGIYNKINKNSMYS